MKNSIYFLVFGIFFLLNPFTSHSQSQTNTDGVTLSLQGFQSRSSELNFLANQNYSSNITSATSSNIVNIKQIGDFNEVSSKTISAQSKIDLIQNGDYNNIELNLNAAVINERVIQNGDRNTFVDINTFGVNLHEAEIIQNGNNQSLTWYGSNSISERMKVNMQGNDKIIEVRSFN